MDRIHGRIIGLLIGRDQLHKNDFKGVNFVTCCGEVDLFGAAEGMERRKDM